MCGIAGMLELHGSRGPSAERRGLLLQMIDLMGHRGPDEAGLFLDERAALAAVRLSINDLAHGQQPVTDPRGRFWIVYNGEIYNHVELRLELEQRGHRFHSRCDTEVALRAWLEWGEEAPARFEGGFAFVIYDRDERRAFLVRDCFGKRPLFYQERGGAVIFGSEMKVLPAAGEGALRWSAEGLAAIVAKWTPFGDETPFAGTRQVPPGTILRVSERGIAQRRYVDPLAPLAAEEADGGDFEGFAASVAALLGESVRLRLRSDVEVGVLLSGGLDSSVITHLVRARQPRRLQTFSIRFADVRFDESRDQRVLVDAWGLTHSSIEVSVGDIADHFAAALWHAEVPQFRSAFVPMYLLSRTIRERGIKVVLSGEGADEVLLGYDIFKEARLRASWGALDAEERRRRIRALYPYLPYVSDANLRLLEALYARASSGPDEPFASHSWRFANAGLALRLLRSPGDGLGRLGEAMAGLPALHHRSLVRRAQWIEFHTLLQGYLLSSQGDRMLYSHGVEPRCPFLSPALVHAAARAPEHFLLSPDGEEKRALKHAFRASLPPVITSKPKQPYRAPDAAAFCNAGDDGRFVPWVEEVLDPRSLRDTEPVDAPSALRFLEKVRRTPVNALSPREDQAFMTLLSLVVLDRQLVRGLDAPALARRPPLVRDIDRTGTPADGARQ